MPFSPDDIEIKEFVPTLRGYGREEVRAFLRSVAEDVRRLEEQVETARAAPTNGSATSDDRVTDPTLVPPILVDARSAETPALASGSGRSTARLDHHALDPFLPSSLASHPAFGVGRVASSGEGLGGSLETVAGLQRAIGDLTNAIRSLAGTSQRDGFGFAPPADRAQSLLSERLASSWSASTHQSAETDQTVSDTDPAKPGFVERRSADRPWGSAATDTTTGARPSSEADHATERLARNQAMIDVFAPRAFGLASVQVADTPLDAAPVDPLGLTAVAEEATNVVLLKRAVS